MIETKALIIGDPHFKVSNVRDTDLMTEAVLKTARSLDLDFIVVLGDTLDRHESIHVVPLCRSITFLAELKEIAPVYLLIGNHDLKNNKQYLSEEHPFTALKQWTNLKVIDKPSLYKINELPFVFVPFVATGRFMEALDSMHSSCSETGALEILNDWKSATCIFAHQEFKGVQMKAITSVEGDAWDVTYPFVISGHIHSYQEVQENLLYVGTAYQQEFGDSCDKALSYFKFTSSTQRTHERIDLKLPQKYIIKMSCNEVTDYQLPTNADLKISISGTAGELKAIMKHPNVEKWKKEGHKVTYKTIPDVNNNEPILIKATENFSDILYDAVSENIRLKSLYQQIFGNIVNEMNKMKI